MHAEHLEGFVEGHVLKDATSSELQDASSLSAQQSCTLRGQ